MIRPRIILDRVVFTQDGDKGDITVAGNNTSWTVDENINKDWTGTHSFLDNSFEIRDNTDETKKVNFQASGITTATTRTYALPNANGTLALLSDISGNANKLNGSYSIVEDSDLTYTITWDSYTIGGVTYLAGSDTVTLSADEAPLVRIDRFVLDSGGLTVIEGVASENPVLPGINYTTQLDLGFAVVSAIDLDTPTNEWIYRENVEWVGSSTSLGADFENEDNPQAGTYCLDLPDNFNTRYSLETASTTGHDYWEFTDGSFHTSTDYSELNFWFLINSNNGSGSQKADVFLRVQFFKTGAAVSDEKQISHGYYGFKTITDEGEWFNVRIPITDFTFTDTFNTIRFGIAFNDSSPAIPFDFDTNFSCKQDEVKLILA